MPTTISSSGSSPCVILNSVSPIIPIGSTQRHDFTVHDCVLAFDPPKEQYRDSVELSDDPSTVMRLPPLELPTEGTRTIPGAGSMVTSIEL